MSKYIEKVERMTLPIVGLRGLVIFPNIPTSFEISRKQAIKAVKDASSSDGYVFFSAQKNTAAEQHGTDDLYKTGVIAKIKRALKLPDGNYRLLVEGKQRAEMISVFDIGEYYKADVLSKSVFLTENGGIKGEALIRETVAEFQEYAKLLPKISNEIVIAVQAITEPGLLADFIAANVLYKYSDKQEILEEINPYKRLERLSIILERESEILKTELSLHNKVKSQIDRNQREYYLKEQLKAINNELGINDDYSESDEYQDRIYEARLPEMIEEKLLKEAAKLDRMPYGSAESTVIRNYLDTCLELPWTKRTKDRFDVAAAQKILEADHDGLQKVKERVLEYIAVKQLAPDLKGQILCLVGPPGVGKTSVASSIARAMRKKFVRVSLGGIRDEADIRGHRKTYIGSMPGRIINSLHQAGSLNPVILLDEIDKLTRDSHGDPASALLEVLDPDQNKAFRDHFIELPIDLSDCIFIATANTTDTIPRPLIDRMEMIHISSYTRNEKISIFFHHLLPKQLKKHGLTKRNVKVSRDAAIEIIDHYTKEAGVRNLQRETGALCRKVAKIAVEKNIKVHPITQHNVKDYLGKRKIKPDELQRDHLVGVVNGLAWTELGGEMLQVEAATMPGSGKIELTGSLGDVMKESARAVVSYMRTKSKEYGIDGEFYKAKDLHIHFPEGAVPKDGPSAGVTMATALFSELTGKQVRGDVAMTGEISLRGRVLPIGGLAEKSMAAYKAGIKNIIIPEGNVPDLEEVDAAIRESVNFLPVRNVDEVLSIAIQKDCFDIEDAEDYSLEDRRLCMERQENRDIGRAIRIQGV